MSGVPAILRFRTDTAANWTAANPILRAGEPGYESDTDKFKIGDGSTVWNSLGYISFSLAGAGITLSANEINSTLFIGDIKWSFNPSIGAAHGFLPFGSDPVSQTGDYADLYAVVGDMFEAAWTGLGYDASGAGNFYPAPPPQMFPRAAIPRVAVASTDFDDANDRIDDGDALTSGVAPFHIHRDGTAVRFSAGSGTLPSGITEGTVYYARKVNSDQSIELWTTEAAAIAGSGTQVTDFSGASGTVYMYNAGLRVADAFQGHHHLNKYSSEYDTYGAGGSSWKSNFRGAFQDQETTEAFITDPYTDGTNGTPRTTNETRPENILLYGYIKAKAV